jgi:hypothetical protein
MALMAVATDGYAVAPGIIHTVNERTTLSSDSLSCEVSSSFGGLNPEGFTCFTRPHFYEHCTLTTPHRLPTLVKLVFWRLVPSLPEMGW